MVKVGSYYQARFTKRLIKVTKVINYPHVLATTSRNELGQLVTDGKEYPFNLDYFDEVIEWTQMKNTFINKLSTGKWNY